MRRDGGYAWIIVAGAFTAHLVAFGIIYSFTVFFPSILETFGGGRGQTAWAGSIAAALTLGSGALTGRATDRLGPRRVMAAGAVLVALGLVGASYANALWQVYGSFGLVTGLGIGASFVPAVAAVGQAFDRRRGLAMGLAVAGSGVGTLVMALVSDALIDELGWREALRVIAAGAIVVLLLAASVMRGKLVPRGTASARSIVAGNRSFRLLAFSSVVASFGYWVPFVHIVPYATDHGVERAAALVSVMGAGNTIGRVLMGALADRMGRLRMFRMAVVVMTLTVFAWPLATSWTQLAIFGGVYALFAGSFIALLPALAGDYFGAERLGGVTGRLFSAAALGTLLGAPVAGLLFDRYGSYTAAILLAGATLTVGAIAVLMLPQPQRAPIVDPTHA